MNAPVKTPAVDDNRPKLITADQLSKDFDYLEAAVAAAIEVANKLPPVFEDEDDISAAREAVRGLHNEFKRAEAKREDTKAPYLDAGRVVDSWFKLLMKRINDAQAPIEASAKRYLDKKAEEERKRREEEARIAREAERKRQQEAAAAQRAADEERRKAEEARLAAQRAADEATRKAAEQAAAAAKAEADRKDAEARAARQKEIEAVAAATQAQRAADEKPADLARTRAASGGMATLAQSFDFEITELAAVDLEALRSHISRADIEKAIRAYVRIHKDTAPLTGVRIFPTTSAQFR
ncbi:hypothetical protein [Bradyrhizobium lablabi]|uniref:hypothetical protein n=1 Tax=Bradyrhizobium lablabi TaxID=722472 RepID=UPI001BA60132|nr:hypothetical protein [Bradyrhizobium lablabi]MBR0693611.1 hypothetical protein [Bradyrhizobium lablabi]